MSEQDPPTYVSTFCGLIFLWCHLTEVNGRTGPGTITVGLNPSDGTGRTGPVSGRTIYGIGGFPGISLCRLCAVSTSVL